MARASCIQHPRYVAGCIPCRQHTSAYWRARHAGLAAGTWASALIDDEELDRLCRHIDELVAVGGVTRERIVRVAGVSRRVLAGVRVGSGRRVSRVSAEALLGVTVRACLALIDNPAALVDSVGTRRRLQALAVDGWTAARISELLCVPVNSVRWHRNPERLGDVTWSTRERYRLFYEKVQSLADPGGDSDGIRQFAAAAGWMGPERWADEDIDDPDAQPLPAPPDTDDWALTTRLISDALRDPRPGKAADYPRDVQREIARQANRRLGWSYPRIAELLGKNNDNAIDYLLNGRKDRREAQKGK